MTPQERYLKEMEAINEQRRALDRRAMEALATLRSEAGAIDIPEEVVYAAQC